MSDIFTPTGVLINRVTTWQSGLGVLPSQCSMGGDHTITQIRVVASSIGSNGGYSIESTLNGSAK